MSFRVTSLRNLYKKVGDSPTSHASFSPRLPDLTGSIDVIPLPYTQPEMLFWRTTRRNLDAVAARRLGVGPLLLISRNPKSGTARAKSPGFSCASWIGETRSNASGAC